MEVLGAFFTQVSFDEVALTVIACLLLREALVRNLPDHVAGPGGWLIDTGSKAERAARSAPPKS